MAKWQNNPQWLFDAYRGLLHSSVETSQRNRDSLNLSLAGVSVIHSELLKSYDKIWISTVNGKAASSIGCVHSELSPLIDVLIAQAFEVWNVFGTDQLQQSMVPEAERIAEDYAERQSDRNLDITSIEHIAEGMTRYLAENKVYESAARVIIGSIKEIAKLEHLKREGLIDEDAYALGLNPIIDNLDRLGVNGLDRFFNVYPQLEKQLAYDQTLVADRDGRYNTPRSERYKELRDDMSPAQRERLYTEIMGQNYGAVADAKNKFINAQLLKLKQVSGYDQDNTSLQETIHNGLLHDDQPATVRAAREAEIIYAINNGLGQLQIQPKQEINAQEKVQISAPDQTLALTEGTTAELAHNSREIETDDNCGVKKNSRNGSSELQNYENARSTKPHTPPQETTGNGAPPTDTPKKEEESSAVEKDHLRTAGKLGATALAGAIAYDGAKNWRNRDQANDTVSDKSNKLRFSKIVQTAGAIAIGAIVWRGTLSKESPNQR